MEYFDVNVRETGKYAILTIVQLKKIKIKMLWEFLKSRMKSL